MHNKKCSKCKVEKQISEFKKDKTKLDGLYSSCNQCVKIYNNSRLFTKELNKKNKICSTCKNNKSISEFYSCKRRIDGYDGICKSCVHSHKQLPHIKNKFNTYMRDKRKNEPHYKISNALRCRIRAALNGIKKSKSTEKLIGCTIEYLKVYLENQFKEGMTWQNHGTDGWHIDHVRPCKSFDLSDPEQQKQCFHYTNLQPLWWWENLEKGGKWENTTSQ